MSYKKSVLIKIHSSNRELIMKLQQLPSKPLLSMSISFLLLAGCSTQEEMQPTTESVSQAADAEVSPVIVVEPSPTQVATESERLGTQWGDEVESKINTVDLRRVSSEPIEGMQVSYADKSYSGRALNNMSLVAGKVDFSVITDRGTLPIYRDGTNYYLQGQAGQPYRLSYHNNSDNIYEIVASVDGINVLDGSTASRYNHGYVLYPHNDLVIEGFRKSQNAVASFIFSKPQDAYAANTPSGSIQNTGVIGSVVYELYDPTKQSYQQPQAFPADNGYAPAPK